MLNKYKYTMLVMIVILIIYFIVMAISYYNLKKKMKRKLNDNNSSERDYIDKVKAPAPKEMPIIMQQQQQQMKITIPMYNDLFILFKELIKYITSIKEISNLIEMNAEVSASIVSDYTKGGAEYVSYSNLIFWYESYMRQLILYFMYVRDVFTNVSPLMEETARNEFVKQIGYAGNFIDTELAKGWFKYD